MLGASLMFIHNLTLCNITKAFNSASSSPSLQFAGNSTIKPFCSSPSAGTLDREAFGARDGDSSVDLSSIELVKPESDALGDELVVVGDQAEAGRVCETEMMTQSDTGP